MTTCPQLSHHITATATGRVTHCEPCGLPLTADGLCPFHDGVEQDVPPPPPAPPWTAGMDAAGLGWLEREKNRLGGWREYGREYGKRAVREERR